MADARLTVQIDGRDNLSNELKRIESKVIRFVGAVSSALTVISVIGFPVKEAADFQRELLNASKTTGFLAKDLNILKQGLRDLSTQTNVTAVDLARIATLGGQIGIGTRGPNALLEFTKVVATAASALDLSAEQVVVSFGKLVNIFDIAPNEFENAISAINAVANTANALPEQLFDVIRRIGDLGGSVDLPGATALSATLLDLGLTAETAGTTLTKIFIDFRAKAADIVPILSQVTTASGQTINSIEEWITLLDTDGIEALNLYIAALSKMDSATATQVQTQITGAGRIAGANNKLIAQYERQAALIARAEEAQRRANEEAESAGPDASSTRTLQRQADVLRDAAQNANILSRHLATATEEYTKGTSAQKEQETVLAGLIAQFNVFLNNVRNITSTIGDQLIPALTNSLRKMSAALRDAANVASVRRAVSDIINAVGAIRDAIGFVVEQLGVLTGSTGIDWGAILRIGALLAGAAAIKTLGSLLSGFATGLLAAVPGVASFGRVLFGVKASADAASNSIDKTGASAARTGGAFAAAGARFSAFANTIAQQSGRFAAAQAKYQALVAATQTKLGSAQAQIAGLFQRAQGARTVAEIEAKILGLQQRQQAAIRANNSASARGLQTQINYLTGVRAEILKNQAAAAAYQNQISRFNRALLLASQGLSRVSLSGQLSAFAARAAEAGRTAGQRLSAGFQASVRGVRIAPTIFASFVAQAQAAGAAASRALSTALSNPQALTFGQRLRAALASVQVGVAAVGQRMTTLGGTIHTVSAAGALSIGKMTAAMGAFAAATGGAAARAAGFGAAWAVAGSRTAKGIVLAATAVKGFSVAIRGVFALISRFVGIAFFALIAVDLLKAVGLWEKLKGLIRETLELLKIPVPDFLQSQESLKERDRELKALQDSYAKAAQAASAFSDELEAEFRAAQQLNKSPTIHASVTFDIEDPTKALENTKRLIEGTVTAAAKRAAIDLDLKLIAEGLVDREEQLLRLKEEQRIADEKLASSSLVDRLAGRFDGVVAAIQGAKKEQSRLNEEIAGLSARQSTLQATRDTFEDIGGTLADVLALTATTSEGLALLAKAPDGTAHIALFSELVVKHKELKEQRDALVRDRAVSPDQLIPFQKYKSELSALEDDLDSTVGRLLTLKKEILKQSGGSPLVKETLDQLEQLGPAARSVAAELVDGLKGAQFQGLAAPTITQDNILEAGVTFEVTRQLADMYQSWADLAAENANKAKNLASQALGEVRRLAQQTQQVIDRIAERQRQSRQTANNQLRDREQDAQSRKRIEDINREFDIERALLEQKFAIQNRALAEQEAGGIRLNQIKQRQYEAERRALFDLEERRKKALEVETDSAALERGRRETQQQLAAFSELASAARTYRQQVAAANDIIKNTSRPIGERLSAINERAEAIDRLKSLYQQLKTSAEQIAGIQPIAGQVLVSDSEFERLRSTIRAVEGELSQATLAGANSIQSVFQAASGALAGRAKQFRDLAKQAAEGLRNLSQNPAEAARQVANLLANSQEYLDALGRIRDRTAQGLIDPEAIQFGDVKGEINDLKNTLIDGLADADLEAGVSLTVDERLLSDSIFDALATDLGLSQQEQLNVKATVDAQIKEGAAKQIRTAVEEELAQIDAKIKGTIELDGNIDIPVKIVKAAKGGYVNDLVQRLAGGGKVRGPGGPTDDKVPAMLSHGEYVMDALTTYRFGPKFFETLQKMARAGTASQIVRNLSLPKFATGGLVSADRLTPFSGIANDFKPSDTATPRDIMEVIIASGQDRATIQAERKQAQTLVGILRNFEKGRG